MRGPINQNMGKKQRKKSYAEKRGSKEKPRWKNDWLRKLDPGVMKLRINGQKELLRHSHQKMII